MHPPAYGRPTHAFSDNGGPSHASSSLWQTNSCILQLMEDQLMHPSAYGRPTQASSSIWQNNSCILQLMADQLKHPPAYGRPTHASSSLWQTNPCFVHRVFIDVKPCVFMLVSCSTEVQSPCSIEQGLSRLHGKISSCYSLGLYLRTLADLFLNKTWGEGGFPS